MGFKAVLVTWMSPLLDSHTNLKWPGLTQSQPWIQGSTASESDSCTFHDSVGFYIQIWYSMATVITWRQVWLWFSKCKLAWPQCFSWGRPRKNCIIWANHMQNCSKLHRDTRTCSLLITVELAMIMITWGGYFDRLPSKYFFLLRPYMKMIYFCFDGCVSPSLDPQLLLTTCPDACQPACPALPAKARPVFWLPYLQDGFATIPVQLTLHYIPTGGFTTSLCRPVYFSSQV